MRLYFRGWARDHGQKVVFSRKLSDAQVVRDNISEYPREPTLINAIPLDEKLKHIEINFHADLKSNPLNGEYLGGLRLSAIDVKILYDEMFREWTTEQISELNVKINDIRELE